MKRIIIAILFCTPFIVSAQSFTVEFKPLSKIIFKGKVIDSSFENSPLVFASVEVLETSTKVNTNVNGVFKLYLKPGTYTLKIAFIGYETKVIKDFKIHSEHQQLTTINLNPLTLPSIVEAQVNTTLNNITKM